jgi:hypothetical protein
MPRHMGAWIETGEKGNRRLMPEETSKGLGALKEERTTLSASMLLCTTSLFHWEYLSSSLMLPSEEDSTLLTEALTDDDDWLTLDLEEEQTGPPFHWVPPDLSEGRDWYNKQVARLWEAALTLPNLDAVVKEGLEFLKIHQRNYTATGPAPKQLQLLWWEFPPEHWEALREGCHMNFLAEPMACIHDNTPMDPEQINVAAAFVDELLELKIVKLVGEGKEVLTTAPLFTVPKEGQEGE